MINPDIAYNLRFTIYPPYPVNSVCQRTYFVLKVCNATSAFKMFASELALVFKVGASELGFVFKVGASELAPTP